MLEFKEYHSYESIPTQQNVIYYRTKPFGFKIIQAILNKISESIYPNTISGTFHTHITLIFTINNEKTFHYMTFNENKIELLIKNSAILEYDLQKPDSIEQILNWFTNYIKNAKLI